MEYAILLRKCPMTNKNEPNHFLSGS